MDQFESRSKFNEAIKEIRILISYSNKNKKDILKYGTFNKSAIVLLCSKFEAFLEEFLEEYAFFHINNSNNKNLDEDIFNHLVENIIDSINPVKSNKAKREVIIKELVILYAEQENNNIGLDRVSSQLKMGKHGEAEVKRLLSCFGFKDYSEEIDSKSFFKKFNSLLNIRNNIIHQDATPSLTHQDVDGYLNETINFIDKLEKQALVNIKKLLDQIQASSCISSLTTN